MKHIPPVSLVTSSTQIGKSASTTWRQDTARVQHANKTWIRRARKQNSLQQPFDNFQSHSCWFRYIHVVWRREALGQYQYDKLDDFRKCCLRSCCRGMFSLEGFGLEDAERRPFYWLLVCRWFKLRAQILSLCMLPITRQTISSLCIINGGNPFGKIYTDEWHWRFRVGTKLANKLRKCVKSKDTTCFETYSV